MIGIDIVKSETKKKESNYCRFREYFNKLLVHLFICVPPCRTQKQIRSKNQKKKFFQLPLFYFFSCFSRTTFVVDLASSPPLIIITQQGPLRPSRSNIYYFVEFWQNPAMPDPDVEAYKKKLRKIYIIITMTMIYNITMIMVIKYLYL